MFVVFGELENQFIFPVPAFSASRVLL